MTEPIIIIGSGFAAYQLVKTIRRMDREIPVTVLTADDGHEYNKPDLSHVFSKQQTADDLVLKYADVFADEYNITLLTQTVVEHVDTQAHYVRSNGQKYFYSKLVFATGATTFIPPVQGDAAHRVMTANSLTELRALEPNVRQAQRVAIIGGGLIGVEIAMDLARSGKSVVVVEPNTHLLGTLVPEFVARPLESKMRQLGTTLCLGESVVEVNQQEQSLSLTLQSGKKVTMDLVISAAGLTPNTKLAAQAGIQVNQGICVDTSLRTSASDVFALGDCAEVEGQIRPYLQAISLSANTLGKQLLGVDGGLTLPAIMVKVKTPNYPIYMAGDIHSAICWDINMVSSGIVVRASDDDQQLTGFVVTGEQVTQAYTLFRQLSKAI
ncbi:NADH:flavorubredoxin reductase NorW [Salinivibrio sp. SS2]|uniref:NADH:flavorubredoxin reductase NorW n=1 Tax=Salinivibrio sp. SS2 TaxID=1892894 RepID=UPI00084CBF57|nr:NADH:flavorubredoxin reductase NorW [Salinivibrio sp. DV]ODQ00531.1 NADH:flavorubredoxin oxidoreductase [Salinivibrio sp. DV]